MNEDENLFELEIKNLDTNEIFTMQIPISIGEKDDLNQSGGHSLNNQNYASKRK